MYFVKLSKFANCHGNIADNEQGLALLGDLKNVRPEPLLIEKQMYKITYKCPPMFVLPEQLLPCCC
jgi:hypothetical protein